MSMSIQAIEEDEEAGGYDQIENSDTFKAGKSILKSKPSMNKRSNIQEEEHRNQVPEVISSKLHKQSGVEAEDSGYMSKKQTFNSAQSNRKPSSSALSRSNAAQELDSQERESSLYRPSRGRGENRPPQAKKSRAVAKQAGV